MSLWTPNGVGELQSIISSVSTPGNIMGVEVGPGSGVKGSWFEIFSGAQITYDVYAISIYFNTVAVAADNRNNIDDVGFDPAGGTNYTVLIPDLISSNAASGSQGSGHSYYFPAFIPAGSSIAVRAQSNSGGSHEVWIQVFGKPKDPSKTWVGTECTAFGINSGSSIGTAVTSGTTSEGSWTQIASSISKDYHWWQASMGISDTTMTNGNIYHLDIAYGDASNKHIIMQDLRFTVTTANESTATTGFTAGSWRTVKNGQNLYARIQCSGTADSNIYAAIWGLR